MPADPSTLAAAVGRALKTWRQGQGRTADDVAVAMGRLELGWTRSSVATLENGARDLTAGELALLPMALSISVGRPVSLDELFDEIDPEATVRLAGECTTSFRVARHLLAGGVPAVEERPGVVAGSGERPSVTTTDTTVRPSTVIATAAVPRPAAIGELERRTARRLGLAPEEVAEVAVQLFGRTLTSERDRRVGEQVSVDASPRTVQALRGHVSRQLLTKLRAVVNARASNGGRDGARPDAGER